MKALKVIGILALAVIVPGGIYAAYEINLLMQLSYSMVGYKFRLFDGKYIHFDLSYLIQNKSHINIGLSGYNINIYLNDKFVSNVSSNNPISIKGRGMGNILIPVNFDVLGTFGAVKSKEVLGYFMKKEYQKIYISLQGAITSKVLGINIPYKVNQKITLAEIIEIMDSQN